MYSYASFKTIAFLFVWNLCWKFPIVKVLLLLNLKVSTFLKHVICYSFTNRNFSQIYGIKETKFPGYYSHTLGTLRTDFYMTVTLTRKITRFLLSGVRNVYIWKKLLQSIIYLMCNLQTWNHSYQRPCHQLHNLCTSVKLNPVQDRYHIQSFWQHHYPLHYLTYISQQE